LIDVAGSAAWFSASSRHRHHHNKTIEHDPRKPSQRNFLSDELVDFIAELCGSRLSRLGLLALG